MSRAGSGEPLYEGSPARESWRQSFLSRQSILWWGVHHHKASIRSIRQSLTQAEHNARVYELRSTGEVDALLRSATRPPSIRLERMTREELARYGLDGGD